MRIPPSFNLSKGEKVLLIDMEEANVRTERKQRRRRKAK